MASLLLTSGHLLAGTTQASPAPGVVVLRPPPWSPGDPAVAGAGEFQVLISVARQQREHGAVGIVVASDRNGILLSGGAHALRFFSLQGVPVLKLSGAGHKTHDLQGLFLEDNHLTEAQAAAVLTNCLQRFGSLPRALDPDRPTSAELAAIRSALRPFREALAVADGERVTVQ